MPEISMLDLDLFSFGAGIMTREVLECEPLDLFRELYREEGPDALPPAAVATRTGPR